MISLENISITVDHCNNSSSTNPVVVFRNTTNRNSNTLFGLGFTLSDTLTTLNQNCDYTLNVTIPAAEGYSGSVTTQFTIKLRIQ